MSWLSCIFSNVVLASLLALAAWFVQRRLGRHAVARILWVIVLIKLVTPPLISVPLGGSPGTGISATVACALGTCRCGPHTAIQAVVRDGLPWILLVAWFAGAGATLLAARRRWVRFDRLLAHACPAAPEWQSLAARLALELSIRRPPEILAVPGRLPPVVVPGCRRPRLLLPMDLIGRLNTSQREALLLHELVHIQRGDHLVRMLELAVGAAYWWLPVVGSVGRHLRACEEACCDAAVVAYRPHARREYATLLLDMVDLADPLPRQAIPQATGMAAADDLEQRVRGILDATHRSRRTSPVGVLAVGLACVLLPCGLRYEFAGFAEQDVARRPAPAGTAAELEPAAEAALRSGGGHEIQLNPVCCPG